MIRPYLFLSFSYLIGDKLALVKIAYSDPVGEHRSSMEKQRFLVLLSFSRLELE